MEPVPTLLLVGLSHRTAPIEVRERYAIHPRDLATCLQSLRSIEGVVETFAVSTCNRTEVLVTCAAATDPREDIISKVFRNIDREHLYVFRGIHAVIHHFRVAAGLDSLVLGESEVLAQVKTSCDVAMQEGCLGVELTPLVQQALRVGKRMRTETVLGEGTLSVARVGVDIAQHVFGTFEKRKALVIGAGETGILVARHLSDLGIGELVFANRTVERAQKVAAEFGARAIGLDELSEAILSADAVITAIDADAPVVDAQVVDKRNVARRDRPLLVVDLSVPRAVDAVLADWEGVLLYDLDDLEEVVQKNREKREAAGEQSAAILIGEVHKYLSLRTFATFTPAIQKLRERFARVREDAMDKVCGDTVDATHVQLAHELEKRLLDVALSQMKESARHASSEADLDREYQRFLENL